MRIVITQTAVHDIWSVHVDDQAPRRHAAYTKDVAALIEATITEHMAKSAPQAPDTLVRGGEKKLVSDDDGGSSE